MESPDAMDHIEVQDWKKPLQACPSAFAPTTTSIVNLLAENPKYHVMVGGITVQDELEWLWKCDISFKKMKETVVDQELPVSKRANFNCQKPMFAGVNPAFEKKS